MWLTIKHYHLSYPGANVNSTRVTGFPHFRSATVLFEHQLSGGTQSTFRLLLILGSFLVLIPLVVLGCFLKWLIRFVVVNSDAPIIGSVIGL